MVLYRFLVKVFIWKCLVYIVATIVNSVADLLASNTDMFEDNSTKSFSQLLFDVARDQVIVGAR